MNGADLPRWDSALAVVAHPDDESFGLGAVLSAFIDSGTRVSVLCFTRGEASTLHGDTDDLAKTRANELAQAARELGITDVHLLSYPDGQLGALDPNELTQAILDVAALIHPDGLITFDASGVTGHPDHQCATAVATQVAATLGIAALGWTVPNSVAEVLNAEFGSQFAGHGPSDIDLSITVDRARQRRAIDLHPSQAVPGSVLWRRLDLLADREYLRWLYRPGRTN